MEESSRPAPEHQQPPMARAWEGIGRSRLTAGRNSRSSEHRMPQRYRLQFSLDSERCTGKYVMGHPPQRQARMRPACTISTCQQSRSHCIGGRVLSAGCATPTPTQTRRQHRLPSILVPDDSSKSGAADRGDRSHHSADGTVSRCNASPKPARILWNTASHRDAPCGAEPPGDAIGDA